MKMSHKSHDKPKNIVEICLNLNSIWDFCEINESPIYGHCFLHSIISSVKAQLNEEQDIRIDHLLQLIISKVFANCKRYSLTFDNNDESLLFEGLHQYVYNKHYDPDFGDLVPIIICEELDIDLIVIEDSNVTHVKPGEPRPENTPVILHKIRKHYNGIIPKPMRDHDDDDNDDDYDDGDGDDDDGGDDDDDDDDDDDGDDDDDNDDHGNDNSDKDIDDNTPQDFLYHVQEHRKSNLRIMIIGSLNINSIRNKFQTIEFTLKTVTFTYWHWV